MSRPIWDEMGIGTAKLYAERGTCPRMQVGAVFVRDNRPLAVGYNGAPAGMPHCTDVGCDLYWYGDETITEYVQTSDSHDQYSYTKKIMNPKNLVQRCRRAIHAEKNAVGYAARVGIPLEGSILYIYPVGPCRECELLLATVGVKEVVFPRKAYNYDVSAPILQELGIKVRIIDVP